MLSSNYKIPRRLKYNFYLSNYQSEKWFDQLVSILHKSFELNRVIDVGVNIGQSLLRFKSVNPNIHYLGFEPNIYCVSLTETIIQMNGLKNAQIIPVGLSDRQSLLKFPINKDDNMDSKSSLVAGFRKEEKSLFSYVSAVALDEIIENVCSQQIDLIKLRSLKKEVILKP